MLYALISLDAPKDSNTSTLDYRVNCFRISIRVWLEQMVSYIAVLMQTPEIALPRTRSADSPE